MKIWILLVLLLICGGEERWDIKTLQDPEVSKIHFTPKQATVHQLTHITTFIAKRTTKRQLIESQSYRVRAIVVDYFKEADEDIHVVLKDLKTEETMIAEIPDGTCDRVKDSKYADFYVSARTWFLDNVEKGKPYTFVGILFVDIKHPTPQRGVTPNNVELHPVLTIAKN